MEEKDIFISTIHTLNATNASLSKTIESQSKTIEFLELRIKKLSVQVVYLNRQLFGRKSEKLQDPLQMNLFADMAVDTQVESQQESEETITKEVKTNKKQARKNRTMLENLPVLKRDEIDVEGIDQTRYRKIGEEITEVVEFEPRKLYRHQYVRFKYGPIDPMEPVEKGEGIKIAPMPVLPIYKGVAGASLLTEVTPSEVRVPHSLLPSDKAIRASRHQGTYRKFHERMVQASDGSLEAAVRGLKERGVQIGLLSGRRDHHSRSGQGEA